jgi:hypothetical protein
MCIYCPTFGVLTAVWLNILLCCYATQQTAVEISELLRILILYAAAQHVFLDSFTLKIKALHSSETSVNYLPIDMV